MKISLDWLQDFIELTESDHETIKATITARSAEIETMEQIGEHLDKIIVGQITEVLPHPNADKLRICKVDDGSQHIQVVCGGSNLKEGMKVAFATLGAIVKWHGTEVVKMEKARIRGEESFGMICAAEEIGLDEMFPKKEEKEIVDLSALNSPAGTPLAKALGMSDTVIDVDNHAITNRPDLFSQKGFAREFVACGLGKWKKGRGAGNPTPLFANNSPLPIDIEIKDPDTCSRYTAVYFTGIEVKESPEWMKKRLSACGIRPISNIVDITNYVMLELGMPTHAFDLDQVKGKKWVMRKSKKGEKVITLDEKELELFEGITVLDDGNELFDLCGIMGGLHSGINAKTDRVLLHSPVYNPSLTRRSMRGLNQVSEAAIIYEKGLHDELAMEGLARCTELILELCPGAKVASKVVDVRNRPEEKRALELRAARLKNLTGMEIPEKEVTRILETLGFAVEKKGKADKTVFHLTVPAWRHGDIKMEADVIEEVARVYSYDNIPYELPVEALRPTPVNPRRDFEKSLTEKLTAYGFDEILTFAFLGEDLLNKCGLERNAETIEIANPISGEMALMRQSLLPRMLETVASNLRFQKTLRCFEMSRVYWKEGGKAKEAETLALATAGEDLRTLQGALEALGLECRPASNIPLLAHPGRTADLLIRGKKAGSCFELHPQIAEKLGMESRANDARATAGRVILAEIDLETWLSTGATLKTLYTPLARFPSVQLDVSIQVPEKSLAETYRKTMEKADKALIESVRLIDEYKGEKVEKDTRALTWTVTYRATDRTLTDEEVGKVHETVLKRLKDAGATIRV